MDDRQRSTLFKGLVIALGVYSLSWIVPWVLRGRLPDETVAWLAFALNAAALLFAAVWFLMVYRGYRIGKPVSRSERRAKEHAREEREKRMRLNR